MKDESRPKPPPATHISEQAQALMRQLIATPPPDPVSDYKAFRTLICNIAGARNDLLDSTVSKSAVDTNSVQSYWINSPQQTDPKRVILYAHGGAYVAGDASVMIEHPSRIGRATGMKVLSVDYRLAPEDPWPAALNDCLDAHSWLIEQGYAPESIGWAGISAGGGLVLAMANAAKERGIPLSGAIHAMSAYADLTNSGDSYTTVAPSDPFMGHADMDKLSQMYTGDADPRSPTISPIYGELAGLPPTLIDAGSREILVSDTTRWAHRARRAGVDVTLEIWDGLFHGFHIDANLPEAQDVTRQGAEFFKAHLAD